MKLVNPVGREATSLNTEANYDTTGTGKTAGTCQWETCHGSTEHGTSEAVKQSYFKE